MNYQVESKMTLEEAKNKLLKDPAFKKEYERFDLWFEIQQKWLELQILLSIWKEKLWKI